MSKKKNIQTLNSNLFKNLILKLYRFGNLIKDIYIGIASEN